MNRRLAVLITCLAGSAPALATPDLLCLTDRGDIWIADGLENGDFAPPVFVQETTIFHDASNNWQTVSGSITGDARTDLVAAGFGGRLYLARNSSGTFAPVEEQSGGYDFDVLNGALIIPGDFDGDGDTDLVQIESAGNVLLGRNDAGTFADLQQVLTGEVIFSFDKERWVGAGDHDGDGRDDLLTVEGDEGSIRWYRSTGTGFAPAVDLGPSGFRMDFRDGWGLHLGDFNGDERDDLLCVTEFGEAWVMPSNGAGWMGHGNWGAIGFHDAPLMGRGWSVLVADFNEDGRDDLLCVTEFGDVWVAESAGSSFAPPSRRAWLGFRSHPAGPFKTFVGDFRD
ncbi:MAG: hypothetical protein PWP23_3138 [Candidatus Sumerlaeota bacterium]|nr:hypothetical protein [Candidatus Sumerlaeota bacterium]